MKPSQRNNESAYYDVLKRITRYDSVERLRKNAEKLYGVFYEEAIEMAYANIQEEARMAIRGKRKPRVRP